MRYITLLILLFALALSAGVSAAAGPVYAIVDDTAGDVYFAKGSSTLDDKAKARLKALAAGLKARPRTKLMLAGYDDPGLPAGESVKLGLGRADAVAGYLASEGVDAGRISVTAFGNTRGAPKDTDPALGNRRVRYRVVDPDAPSGGGGGLCQRCKK